jgi:hypothetical protein
MVLMVASDEAYTYLADVFWYDWNVEPYHRRPGVLEEADLSESM